MVYTVLTSGTPSEAIDIAEEHSGEIHLLVTDVILPEMNGNHENHRLYRTGRYHSKNIEASDLWETRNHDPLKVAYVQENELIYDDEYVQVPFVEWVQ